MRVEEKIGKVWEERSKKRKRKRKRKREGKKGGMGG